MIRFLCLLLVLALPVAAQDMPRATVVAVAGEGDAEEVELTLTLDRAVPWRVFVEADPWRLVLDTSEVDWSTLPAGGLDGIGQTLAGRISPGWSRLLLALDGPMVVTAASMASGSPATITVTLEEGTPRTGPLVPLAWQAAPAPIDVTPRPRQDGSRPLVVALDPGHGGIDSGAERGGVTEADLMLRFAGELAAVLRRDGHQVVFTRDGDEFVGLRGRTTVARAWSADLLISLHADAVEGGGAEGATVYTLADSDGDALSAELAERQARDDLLLGVELPEQGDEIARVLIDLAQAETAARSEALADALVEGLGEAGVRLHKRPRLGARFTVLKAPDIPSVLLELGFMSDPTDLANLMSPDWRGRMATAVARSVEAWAEIDARAVTRLRQ
ncbi:N-acetylmuramoyl-L-alanine amidase family protein [Jannaschia pohangensis]|uniref:N-acetylmuramoyl-L-alanine amidase n=1 Tax=Jannaschia pohangensis TaxID=390807 RepID=A0A1I3I557_9RHOB|nr:N-acetylmuramoyl-L-alanine amidase [Jannaschia pohangensis]SFI43124.1 N-acetylmuramoyl-L-alanine amidase [Jannaschia pohangensis]